MWAMWQRELAHCGIQLPKGLVVWVREDVGVRLLLSWHLKQCHQTAGMHHQTSRKVTSAHSLSALGRFSRCSLSIHRALPHFYSYAQAMSICHNHLIHLHSSLASICLTDAKITLLLLNISFQEKKRTVTGNVPFPKNPLQSELNSI